MEEKETLSATENTRRKINRNALLSILCATVLIITFFLGYFVRGYSEPAYAQKINEIIKLINSMSVYSSDKDADTLAKYLLKELLKDDKYAYYYTAEEYKRMIAEDGGNYLGLGVGFSSDGQIVRVYLNSPAYNNGQGLKEGDKLFAGTYKGDENYTVFDQKLAEENAGKADNDKKSILDVYAEFLSEFDFGEDIKLQVLRDSETLEFTFAKAQYTVSYVEYKDSEKNFYYFSGENGIESKTPAGESGISGLSPDTAYIKLHAFEGGAAMQFAGALEFMRERGKTKLILDLRDNGGGLINVLLDIASYIINDNGSDEIRILNVKEKDASVHYSTPVNRFYDGADRLTDISVIANKNTASASECLIGALNDYGDTELFSGAAFSLDRLILTEQDDDGVYRTFGKGIMQTTIKLNTGGALKLTTAYIYWPKSRDEENNPICIQDVGIRTEVLENCVSDEDAISRADYVLHAA